MAFSETQEADDVIYYTGRHASFSNLVDASERSSHNAHYTKSNNFHYTLNSRNVNNLKQIEICRQKEMKLRFAVWNARSIAKKAAIVCDIIQSNKLEILAITESWLGKNTDDSSITEILNTLKTYSFVHVPRESGKGGGVGVFYSKQLSITMNSDNVFKSFEHINLNVVSGKLNTHLIVIYRPLPSKKNKLTTSMFFTEFHDLLELMSQHEQPLLIAGDFNFHLDDTTNCDTIKFMDILDSANLSQHVLGSTHRKGHTLDLIITQHNSNLVTDVRILNDVFSDHQVVTCKLNCPRPPLSKIPLTFRSTKQLNGDVFIATLKESLANQDLSVKTDIDKMVDIYNSTLKDIYDKLAPVQTRVVNHRPWAPWYNEDLREAKREKRRAERKFRKTKLTVNKHMYIEACERYNRLLENCKTSYYKNKIEGADRNRLFCLVNSLFKTGKNILPTHNSREVLADEFNTYFINKIRGIRNEIEKLHPASQTKDTMSAILPLTQLSEFNLPDNNATEKVIRSMPSKTCSLDPIPTHVVKNHLNLLLPAIQSIIISSLSSGTFPSQLKISQVKPKLKKNDLDKN